MIDFFINNLYHQFYLMIYQVLFFIIVLVIILFLILHLFILLINCYFRNLNKVILNLIMYQGLNLNCLLLSLISCDHIQDKEPNIVLVTTMAFVYHTLYNFSSL